MLTVKQASELLGISNTTLRDRGAEYEKYLSDSANPGKGNERRYTEGDIATLRTIGVLKKQKAPEEDLLEALEQGAKLEPEDAPLVPARSSKQVPARSTKAEGKALTVSDAFTDALAAYETQIGKLQDKNDRLHDKLLEATERAARAETKLEAVGIINEATASTGSAAEAPTGSDTGQGWRKRLADWIAPKTTK